MTCAALQIAQSADYIDFGMPWQETTRLIGATLGKSGQAEALVGQVFGIDCRIIPDPVTDAPLVIPIGRKGKRADVQPESLYEPEPGS